MNFYIKFLITNRIQIKTNPDLESDLYNDLLLVEKKIKDLYTERILTQKEFRVLNYIACGKSKKDICTLLGITRLTVYKIYANAIQKITDSLGETFTDESKFAQLENSSICKITYEKEKEYYAE